MVTLLALIIVAALGCFSYFSSRSILNPAVVFCLLWASQLAGLLIFSAHFNEPSAIALLVIVFGTSCFTIGAYLSQSTKGFGLGLPQCRKARDSTTVYLLLAVLVGICVVGQINVLRGLGDFESAALLIYARTLMSVDDEDIYGIYKYGNPIATAGMLLQYANILSGTKKAKNTIFFSYFLLASLVLAVLSTGRGPIILVFLILAAGYVVKRGVKGGAVVVAAIVCVASFLIFWAMGSAMGKVGYSLGEALTNLAENLFSSIPALSSHLDQRPLDLIPAEIGTSTFRFFYALASAVGLAERPGGVVQDFIEVPHLTNLYTMYFQYTKDFGFVGAIIFPLFLGYVHGWLFRQYRRVSQDDLMFYLLVLSYMPLVQVSFQETHFTGLSGWIFLLLIGLAMTKKHSPATLFERAVMSAHHALAPSHSKKD